MEVFLSGDRTHSLLDDLVLEKAKVIFFVWNVVMLISVKY